MEPLTMLLVLSGGATALAAFGSPKKPKATTGAQAPASPPPTGRTYRLDPNLPQHILDQVAGALQSKDGAFMEALATDLDHAYPRSAMALRERESDLLRERTVGAAKTAPAAPTSGTPAPAAPPQASPLASGAPPVAAVPPPATPPSPPVAPTVQQSFDAGGGGSYFGPGLDPTVPMPPGLLASYSIPPAPPLPAAPPVAVVSPPARAPSPVSSATASQRNAGRPLGGPYITLRGEATYPARIAFQATGSEADYPQLSAINPQFVHNGKWMNIQIGDEINIPPAWKAHLSSLYHVTDATTASAAPTWDAATATLVAPAPVSAPPVEQVPSAAAPVSMPPVEAVSAWPFTAPSAAPPPVPIQAIPNAEPLHGSGEAIPISYKTSDPTSGHAPTHTDAPPAASVSTSGRYAVKKGDFPIKIAKALTGDSSRWHELIAANPAKPTKADGNFATLMPGEVLHLPATWSAASGPMASIGGSHAQVA